MNNNIPGIFLLREIPGMPYLCQMNKCSQLFYNCFDGGFVQTLANDNQNLLPVGDGLDGYGVAGGVQLNPAAVCGDKALDAQHVAVPGIV